MSLSIKAAERALGRAAPRYYVKRVLSLSRDADGVSAADHYSITSGPYPDLISACIAAGILHARHPEMMFVAGEMGPQEQLW
jgi:hypothetical protein